MKNSIIKRTISIILTVSFMFTFTQISTVFAVDEVWEVDLTTEVTMPEEASEELIKDTVNVVSTIAPIEATEITEELNDGGFISATLVPMKPIENQKARHVVDIKDLPRYKNNAEIESTSNSADTYSDLESMYDLEILKQSRYNQNVSGDISINPVSGNVNYTYNIASIPGENGSTMDLTLEYNSSASQFVYAGADIEDADEYFSGPYLCYEADESIGAGWKFSGIQRYYPSQYKYVLKDGEIADSELHDYYSIGFISGQATITYIDGTVEYLNDEGFLQYVDDKYGNRTTYTYEEYLDSEGRTDCKLRSITDSLGRSITIDYYDSYINITKPDNTVIRLYTSNVTAEHLGTAHGFDTLLSGKVITQIQDADTSTTLAAFEYEPREFRCLVGPAGRGIQSDDYATYMSMTHVDLSMLGERDIDYTIITNRTTDPILQSSNYRVWYLCADKFYSDVTKTTPQITYSYYFETETANVTVTAVDANNKVVKTQTNDGSNYVLQEIYERKNSVDTLKQSNKTQYDNSNRTRPSSQISTTYNNNGNYITNITENTYDRYGNILTSENEVDGVLRLQQSYTYYTDTYKSLKDVTTKKGSTVYLKTAYEVNALGDVTYERIYDGNNVLQRKTYYEYLSNNLVGKTVYSGDTSIILQQESYSYTGPYMTYAYTFDNSYNIISDIAYTYDNNTGRVLTTTDANTKETIQYDSIGRVIRETHKDGKQIVVNYSPLTNSVIVRDENNYIMEYIYNDMGLLSEVMEENASGNFVSLQTITYDTVGNPVTSKDALNNTTTITYDALGRQTSVKQPGNTATAKAKYLDVILEGDNKYSVYLTISETGRIAVEYYDVYGRLAKTALIKNYSSFTESSFNNIYQMPSNAQMVITSRYVYDDLDRVIEQYDGENRPTYYTYDALGNVINMKQGLATADDPQININYEYDSAGNLVKTTQGTHVTTYEYDYVGRLTKMTDPMKYTETYTYDTAGNVKTSKDKNGVTTTNTYNNRGLLSRTAKGSEYIEYTYDAVGNILTSKDKNGIISYTYNYDSTPATKTYPDGKKITYSAYDSNKNLIMFEDYLENVTYYNYNAQGAVSAVNQYYVGETTTKTTSYTYNTDGSLQKVTYPLSSTTTTTYTYDYAGRVSNLTNKLTSSSTYSTHAYTYDNSGNITQKVENIQGTSTTTSYIYDSFNRLIREDIGSGWNVYHYDQYGNMAYEYGWGDTNYYYDANNRLTSIEDYWTSKEIEGGTKQDDWCTYLTYDKNGNLLKSETDACTSPYESSNYKTYTYDTWGRLTNFSDTLGESASYTYYSDGLRASKTVGSNTTKYYYNGDNVINETLNGNNYATNVLGVNGYISRQQNGTIGYLFKNAHGDVISAYSSTTNKLADYTYDAWGEHRTETETTSFTNNPLRYAGQYYDYESGMTYLRARYYDSSVRRFISEDPIRDGLNWYAYCSNNPVMFVDPTGLDSYILYVPSTSAADASKTTYDEALQWKEKKEEEYGTDAHVLEINDVEEFADAWERISNREGVNAIVIVAHGMISTDGVGYMSMGSGYVYAKDSTDMSSSDYTTDELAFVEMDELTFSTCNSANPDIYNLVYGFKINNKIRGNIVGWDGGTVYDFKKRDNVRGAGKNHFWNTWEDEKNNQGSWWRWVEKDKNGIPKRKRIGKRIIVGS